MINLTLFAALLLTLRLVAVGFLGYILVKQWKFLRRNHKPLNTYRLVLYITMLVTFIGNLVPIAIDVAALTGGYDRANPPLLAIAYAFSNASTSAVSAFGWWFIYRMVEKENGRGRGGSA
jgi:hypothetical protein